MENENAGKPRGSAGIVWTIIIILIIIIGAIIYYYNKNGTAANQYSTSSTTSQSGSPMIPYYTLATTTSTTLGTYITATDGMTLYTYAKDTAGNGKSACTGACATQWPAYTVASSSALTEAPGFTGQISVITRTDGTLQVTYKGMPLYFWYNDVQPGDTLGNGIGGVWYVAKP